MSIFDQLGQQRVQQKQITQEDMRQEVGTIKANPGAYLQNLGYNIPDGMTDPRAITQHLLRSGQVGGGKLQQVLRMIGAPIGR